MEIKISNEWKFKNAITDIDKYYINGLNIWEHRWVNTGEKIYVQDPTHGDVYHEFIYYIESYSNRIYFIAFEFSSNNWGIYLKNKYDVKHVLK